MNAESSRSHELISLRLYTPPSTAAAPPPADFVRPPAATGAAAGSCRRLHLVDLAGSERVGRSGVVGQQLAEAQAINKSLSALGDVVAALQAGAAHVPYRNSKLTAALQDALCGAGKVLLVCNVAPEAEEARETLSSLTFAQRAAQVRCWRACVRAFRAHVRCEAWSVARMLRRLACSAGEAVQLRRRWRWARRRSRRRGSGANRAPAGRRRCGCRRAASRLRRAASGSRWAGRRTRAGGPRRCTFSVCEVGLAV